MIEQVGQGRMLARLEPTTRSVTRSAGVLVLAIGSMFPASTAIARQRNPAPSQRQAEQTQREEGEAILALADAALSGKGLPSDFSLQWQNDFVKAQRGTFVPFTLTADASQFTRRTALVYVRAIRRSEKPEPDSGERKRAARAGEESTYPVDAIFPVDLTHTAGQALRLSRGFSVTAGEYDVVVVMRERVDPEAPRTRPKASVLRQALSVPDFGSTELTTSSVILADRLTVLVEEVPADQLAERPYVIGRNEITPAVDRRFGRDEELIVVFLVYNPMVTPDRQFDVRVEYHFYRKIGVGQQADGEVGRGSHPPERTGER